MSTVATPSAVAGTARARAGKFLTFFLGDEEYGVEILKVHEIIGMLPITRVPRTPAHVRGVINLRGKVIPTMDLRARFGMTPDERVSTCIIVIAVKGVQIGIIVDRVSEVADIAEADIAATPDFGAGVETDYLLGVGKSQGRVRLLLDIDRVLSTQELIELRAVQNADAA